MIATHDEPFQELVDQVREDLQSDTATLLLLDESGAVLEPAASAGLGRLWRGATHVRVGTGFAGRVVAQRSPVQVHDVNPANVLNPILRGAGVQSLVGVPVESEHRVFGVLHVGSREPRVFDALDVKRLQEAADRVGERLARRENLDEHAAALALQRSLLPAAPPRLPGLDIAVRYLPADGDLGGDWYDVFVLPDGRLGFVMGDVQGHGLASAVVMGRLRSALRAYALEHDDPADVLRSLDRKMCHFEHDAFATVAYAVSAPPYGEILLSLAGHPAPLLALPGEAEASICDVAPDPMLGVVPDHERVTHRIDFPDGAVLALFTDGLVDVRPGATGEADPWEARMRRVRLSLVGEDDAETTSSRVIADTLGDDDLEDDVALLVIRRT